MVTIFLEDLIMNNKFDLNDYLKGSIGGNSPITLSNATAIRDYTVERPSQFTAPGYAFTDWARDAASAMWRGAQESDMKANQDEMTDANYAIEQAQALLEAFKMEYNDPDRSSIEDDAINNLRKAGIWSENRDPNQSELEDIINKQQKRYKENEENYFYNKQEYDDSINNYDISQYYTGRSNEAVQTWGNWFYKMPATMGTSWSSPDKQALSFAGGWAGAKAGAAVGSFAGPVGTGIGALLGGIAGAQMLGGIDARKQESHMEAFMGYSEKVKELAKSKGVNISAIADGVREQLNDRGVDTTNMSEDMLIEYALSDNSIQTGSEQFNKIAEDEFAASRRVYDRNNALGMGEIVSDLSYILPIRRVGGQMLSKMFKPLTNAVGKAGKKVIPNAIQDGLNMRFRKGLEIAAAGSSARNRALVKDVWEFTKDAMFRGVIEGTEEGAQAMIVDDYKAGEYDEEYANDGFSDPTEAQSWTDLGETLSLRMDALGAWLGLNDEYKDDQQMTEEMWSGFLLSILNPQGIVAVPKAASRLNNLMQLPKVANYLQHSLTKQDNINARQQYFKNLREGLPSGRNWNEALDLIGEELKNVRADGKTRTYNLDPLAITDGHTAPSNEDVDRFITDQKNNAAVLSANYKALQDVLKKNKVNIPDEDVDLYAALAMDVKDDDDAARGYVAVSRIVEDMQNQQLHSSDTFKEHVDKHIKTAGTKDADDYVLIGKINQLNQMLDYLTSESDSTASREFFKKALRAKGFLSNTNALETAKLALAYDDIAKQIIKERDAAVNQLREKHPGINVDKINALDLIAEDAVAYQTMVKNARTTAKARVFEKLTNEKKEQFFNPSQEFVEEKIAAYKDLLNRQSQLADNANAAARENTEPTKVTSPAQEKLVDMTKEQVEQERINSETQVAEQVAQLESQLATIPEDSHLHSLVENINKNAEFVKQNPLNYARYISRLIKRMKWQYANGEAAKNAPEEVKKQLEEIVSLADSIEAQVDRIVRLNTEAKAKSIRHNAGLKTTLSNSRIWEDENGNKYTVSREDIEYSENEGAIITLKPAVRQGLADEISKTMQQLRDRISELNSDSIKNPDNKKENDKKVTAFDAVLKSLQEHEVDIKNKKIVVNAETARPWLESLKTVDNQGNVETFGEAKDGLNQIIEYVNDAIAENKKHRNERANIAYSDGDVFDYLVNDDDHSEEKRTLPAYKQKNVKWVRDRIRTIKSYPLKDDSRIASSLLNPYHQDFAWNGYFTMEYHNPTAIAEKFGDRATFTRGGVKYDRVKAARTYNYIGKAIADAKAENKYKPEEVYSALEKLFEGSKKETVAGKEITHDEYWNMLMATPFQQYMYSPRTGKQALRLVVTDLGAYDRLTLYSEQERIARAEFVHTMLNKFKSTKNKDAADKEADTYTDISLEGGEAESDYINRFYFNQKSVKVYPGDFNYNMRSVKDERSFLFKNEDGTVMNNTQVQEIYDGKTPAATEAIRPYIKRVVEVLNDVGYANITEDKLNQQDEQGASNLYKAVEAVLKYGDGVLNAQSLAKEMRDAVGELKKLSSVKKDATRDRARDLFHAFAELIPEHFTSFKSPEQGSLESYPIAETVRTNIQHGYFKNKLGIKIHTRDSNTIDESNQVNITSNTEENIKQVTELFEFLQNALNNARTFTEFLSEIKTNYRFVQSGSERIADDTLSEYFYAVKFGRFRNNGNIAQVFSSGSSAPTKEYISYDGFNSRQQKQNTELNKISSLGLIKDEEGHYHFSIKEWVDNNVETSSATQDGTKVLTEMEVKRDTEVAPLKNMMQELQDLLDGSARIKWKNLNQLIARYEVSASLAIEEWAPDNVVQVGDEYKKRNGVNIREAIQNLITILESSIAQKEESYQAEYSKQIEENLKKDESFEGKKHSYVHFAVGSFQTNDGVSIVYRDNQGNPHIVEGANGTPGSVYMLLPGFFSPSGERQVVKLNPAHLDTDMADFVANLLNDVRTGKLKLDDSMSNIRVGKYIVKSNSTVKTVLDQIVFNGTAAIANNPTAEHNIAQFLHVDSTNNIHFGDRILDDSNFNELVEFLMLKPRRIDMNKVTDINALNGVDLSITTEENGETKTLVSRSRYDNYVSMVIDEGLVKSDLAAAKKDRLFAKPNVYTSFEPKHKLSKPVANDSKSEGSAAHANKNANVNPDELVPADDVRNNINDYIGESDISSEDLAETVKQIDKKLTSVLSDLAQNGSIDSKSYRVAIYNKTTGETIILPRKLMEVTYGLLNETTAGFGSAIDNTKFMGLLGLMKQGGTKDINIHIVDDSGNSVKVNGKFAGPWVNLEKLVLPTKQKNKKSSESIPVGDDVRKVVAESVAEAVKPIADLVKILMEGGAIGSGVQSSQPSKQKGSTQSESNVTPQTFKFAFADDTFDVAYGLTKDQFDEAIPGLSDAIPNAYDEYQKQQELHKEDRMVDKKGDTPQPSGEKRKPISFGEPDNSSPTDAFMNVVRSSKQEPQKPSSQPSEQKQVTLPTITELLNFIKANHNDIYDATLSAVLSEQGADLTTSAAYSKYLQNKFGMKPIEATTYLAKTDVKRNIVAVKAKYKQNAKVRLSSIFNFESEHVAKEDYQEALKTVKRILGNVHIEELDVVSEEYDEARDANMYVYGACGESAIWIYKQLIDGKEVIYRGGLYHEAFHKVSLFAFSQKDREKLYKQAREENPELVGKSDKFVEEWLADEFAARVLRWKQQGETSTYSKNYIVRKLQQLLNFIKKIGERFKTNHITDEYVDMNKLFKDMYKGRYAYAKATKQNKELFDKIYQGRLALTGVIVNNAIIAEDAIQYSQIRRDLINRALQHAGIGQYVDGTPYVDMQVVKDSIVAQIKKDQADLAELETYYNNPKLLKESLRIQGDIDRVMITLVRRLEVMHNIIADDAWAEWSDIITDFVKQQFGIEKSDANDQLQHRDGKPVIDNSTERDSYGRNMYEELDIKMKALLWMVVDGNANDPKNLKYTPDGLWIYAKIAKLYNKISRAISNSANVEDMMTKLEEAAQKEIDENNDFTLQQFYARLNPAKVDHNIIGLRNGVYSQFVRHIHNFQNYVYEAEEHNWEDTFGNVHTTYTYQSSVRNGNLDAVSQNIKNTWKRNLTLGFSAIASQLEDRKNSYSKITKPLNDAVSTLNNSRKDPKKELSAIEGVLKQLSDIYAIEFKDNDLSKAAQQIQRAKAVNPLISFAKALASFDSAAIKELSGGRSNANSFQRKFKQLTDIKTPFFDLTERLAQSQQPEPKENSQRGPGNTKVYSIGAYNFITRLFKVRMTQKDWIDKLSRNIYTASSSWLKELRAGAKPEVNTKFSTIVDNDFGDASADIDVAPHEDLLNRIATILSGQFSSPSLANKRFAAAFEGFLFPESVQDVVSKEGVIQDAYVTRYVEFLADEILAISDAIKTREIFMNKLNEITGRSLTIDDFSNMDSEQQENLFRQHPELNSLLNMLVKQYHFSETGTTFKLVDDRYVRRVFHVDLRKGTGYKFRHFKNIGKQIKLTPDVVDRLSKNMGQDHSQRQAAIKEARKIAEQYRSNVIKTLNRNVVATLESFMKEGLLEMQDDINPLTAKVNIADLQNAMIPENLFDKIKGVEPGTNYEITGQLIYNLAAYFTIMDSIGLIEFEKLVTGDIAYLKNITAVNKRYSGPCSTIEMTSEAGFLQNEFSNDRLMNSKTYNTLTVNTSLVVNTAKFKSDLHNVLGIDVVEGFEVKKGTIVPIVNASKLLNEEGKFINEKAELTREYLDHRRNNRSLGLDNNKQPLSNQALAERIVDNAVTRFLNYINNDPSDAQVFISAEMFRQLMQRNQKWDVELEACYNLLENYDNILELNKSHSAELKKMCVELGIEFDDLLKRAQQYHSNPKKYGDEYKSWILTKTSKLDATSLKYVYFGEADQREDGLHSIIYDKMSLSPIFKIFADGHQMAEVYNLMKDRQIDLLKFESAVKIGGMASFELFDENGQINTKSLQNAPIQHQLFELLGKQLNTEPHGAGQTALLTQFMKIANMNIRPDDNYNVGDNTIKGSQIRELYGKIIDDLTIAGQTEFLNDFGLTKHEDGSYTLDKKQFMAKLKAMAMTQDLPIDTLDAFDVDPTTGNFKIHPSAMPNLRWIQSRLISEMGKKVIDTSAPGTALYQVSSVGYDDIFNIGTVADKHLRMPGENGSKHMEVKLSIKFFEDIIKQAKNNKKIASRYNGLETFADQRKFILDNQELFALSYRVPTQGQNSTIPVKIVDIFPPQRGGIIMFPSGITAQTGSDFDIDKMFLARYNYTVDKNGKLAKVKYDLHGYLSGKYQSREQMQNMLLDIYFGVLTSPHHYLSANTPLDVCTAPLSDFAKSVANVGKVVDRLPETPEKGMEDTVHLILNAKNKTFDAYTWDSSKSKFKKQGTVPVTTALYEEQLDLYYTNPVFQTAQKKKNAGSDAGIGPMALNSVFRYFAQVSNLRMLPDEYLNSIGISRIDEIFDRNGDDILDITSALINAHVDAVKDNYIGNVNVNGYTFSTTAFMTSTGFGHDTFAFLTQPILKDLAETWTRRKKGIVVTDPEAAKGKAFMDEIREKWQAKLDELNKEKKQYSISRVSPEEMKVDYLKKAMNNIDTAEGVAQQLRYLDVFEHIYNSANYYSDMINTSQIDTKKYGKSSDEIISFAQSVMQAHSPFNTVFENPSDVFDKTFLGTKWENGVMMLMEAFDSTIFEFSKVYQNACDTLCKQYGKYGRYSKEFMHRVGPRLRSVFHAPFFNQYLLERFPNNTAPLKKLFIGPDSVTARYDAVRNMCYEDGIGIDFFELVTYNPVGKDVIPQFFKISDDVKSDQNIKNQLQASMSEIFNSSRPEVRQWMNDFAVMMFYQTGGTDTNAGGIIKTTAYDIIPPQHLGSITTKAYGTYNDFATSLVNAGQLFNQDQLDQAMMLTALTDDSIVPTLKSKDVKTLVENKGIGDVVYVGYGSNKLKQSGQATFSRFIKVRQPNGQIALYKLGNILVTETEEGKVYSNPLYFRVQNLGYRNKTLSAYSIRTDGMIEDGKIKSLMGNYPQYEATKFSELDELRQVSIRNHKSFRKYQIVNILDADPIMNYAQYVNSDESLGDLQKYVAIDAANVIYYYNQGEDRDLKNYAEFKHNEYRQFIQITDPSDMSNVPVFENATVTLIGTFDQGIVDNLKSVLPPSNIYVDRDGKTLNVKVSAEPTTVVQKAKQRYSRTVARNNPRTLYIFTDNTDRTSYDKSAIGRKPSETNGWYYKKYGRDEHGTDRNSTTAVLRGLDNAAPISTMKWFYKAHPGETVETSRWKDSDIEEFKSILDDEIKQIKDLWQSGNFDKLMLPKGEDAFFNAKISQISPKSEIGKYLKTKLDELMDFVNNYKETPEQMSKEGEQRKKDCL